MGSLRPGLMAALPPWEPRSLSWPWARGEQVHLALCPFPSDGQGLEQAPSLPEPPHLIGAVARRRAEYRAGRLAACHALNALGLPAEQCRPPIMGGDGAPRWPAGVLGSITHCPGYALAAVTRSGPTLGLGLDMEPLLDPSGAEVLAREFLSPAECALIRPVRPTLGVTALLSIKESAYKALSRHARSSFHLDRIHVRLWSPALDWAWAEPETGQIPGWPPGHAVQVRWRQVGRWIVSGCVMVGREGEEGMAGS